MWYRLPYKYPLLPYNLVIRIVLRWNSGCNFPLRLFTAGREFWSVSAAFYRLCYRAWHALVTTNEGDREYSGMQTPIRIWGNADGPMCIAFLRWPSHVGITCIHLETLEMSSLRTSQQYIMSNDWVQKYSTGHIFVTEQFLLGQEDEFYLHMSLSV